LALTVRDAVYDATLRFYVEGMGMRVVWQPDADAAYLSGGSDNLALHRGPAHPVSEPASCLDHLGFLIPSAQDVQAWHARLSAAADDLDVEILAAPRLHRDGATSFYFLDPAGHKVQLVHIPVDGF
jgi:catechol 2,3-dioxygenase-like lactoylglutathione lyase family enzyme